VLAFGRWALENTEATEINWNLDKLEVSLRVQEMIFCCTPCILEGKFELFRDPYLSAFNAPTLNMEKTGYPKIFKPYTRL
jgi:hypothetical protein